MNNQKKSLNWMLLISSLILAASTFLPWLVDEGWGSVLAGRFFGASSDTLLSFDRYGPIGFVFIALAAGNIIFALLRKRIPTYIITALITLLALMMVFAAVSEVQELVYDYAGAGVYVLIAGTVLTIAAHPIFIAVKKRNERK